MAEERLDSDLVRRVEHARSGAAGAAGAFGKRKAAKRIGIGSIEGKAAERAVIQALRRRFPAIGIGERVLDGDAHVGRTEMGDG